MARKIKFAMKMRDDVEVRTLSELKEHFDLERVMTYYLDGKLDTWLADRYYDELYDNIQELDRDAPDLGRRLCELFGVDYEDDALSVEEIEERNRKISLLKEITDDEEIIENIDSVAFSQEELADLLDEGRTRIYLCGSDFRIPVKKKHITYIGINTYLNITENEREKYEKNGIELINLLKEEPTFSMVVDKEISEDVHAVFLCRGREDYEDENFLVYATKQGEPYETEHYDVDNAYEEDDYEEDDEDDEISMDFQYKINLKKINTPEILRYKDAAYIHNKIVFSAEDGQGQFVGVMDVTGQNVKVLRRWNEEEESLWSCEFTENHILARYSSRDDDSEHYQMISVAGDVKEIDINSLMGYMEMPQGFYCLDWCTSGYVSGNILFKGERREKELRIPIKLPETVNDCINCLYGCRYADYNEEKIYFFVGNDSGCPFGKEGYFYVYDIKRKTIKPASKIFIEYFCGTFCVHDKEIIYIGAESYENRDPKLMVLNMKTGRQKCLWDAIGEYGMPVIDQMKIVDDYLYLLETKAPYFRMGAYRIRLDGTERTEIGCKKSFLESSISFLGELAAILKDQNGEVLEDTEVPINRYIKKIEKIC
ncbi:MULTISPECIES: hypothetical protein [Enterocloster]|uniref:hypothetical protein n=1 Tax=Enterocloster TaxID=2719313 RepID=UPI00040DA983|nr:hypothetical protein [Enterocloster bolteae]UOX68477.1 hypothetical protein K4205_19200 [Enterocloster bolteae]